LLASMLIPGRRSQGLVLTCVIGIAGALAGGRAAISLSTSTACRGSSRYPPGSPPGQPFCCSPPILVTGQPAVPANRLVRAPL